jgi:O-antigen/teichoic acid export membrane protein
MQSTERRVTGGAAWALAGRVLGVLAQGLMIFLLPRFLSLEEFGAFRQLAPFLLLAAVVGTLGLNDGNVRLLSEALARRDAGRLKFLLRASFLLTLGLSLLAGIIAAVWLVTNNPSIVEYSPAWILGPTLAVGVVLMALHLITAESLRGLHDIRLASMFSGGGTGGPLVTLLFAGGITIIYAAGWISLSSVMLMYVASLAIVLPAGMYFLARVSRRSLQEIQAVVVDEHQQPGWKDVLSVAIPLMFVHLLVFFTMNADVWIVGWFFDLDDAGLYAAARGLMLAVTLPGQVAAQAVMSSIPDLSARGQLRQLEALLRRTALFSALPAAAVGIVLIAAPTLALTLGCGEKYAAAAPILVILSVGNLLVACFGNPIHALIMTGRHYYGLVVYVLAAAILAVGGPLAAAHFGALGIAVVSAVCLVFQSVASWGLARCTVGVWTHPGWRSAAEPTPAIDDPIDDSVAAEISPVS